MKARDLLILAGLILLILGLTIAEKYADRRREQQRTEAVAGDRALWEQRMNSALEKRWQELSGQLRKTLDSMAADLVAGGVPRESLAAVILDSAYPGPPAKTRSSKPVASEDTLAGAVLREYNKGLNALPSDLSAYEQRVATNEVVSMIRAKFGLSDRQFDSLLKLHQGGSK